MKKLFNSTVIFCGLFALFSGIGSSASASAIDDPKYPFHPEKVLDFQSSNLPVVIINLEERMADKEEDRRVPGVIKILWNEDGTRNDSKDEPHYEGPIGIKYRGNSSYKTSDKKPFSVRTQDENGKKKKVPMLDMPADDDWALLAPYNDRSMIRDVLLFELMRGTFEYTPTGRHCELILNGVYQGVYILAARARQGENRINIKAPTADEGIGLTGGYHLEMDRPDDPGFRGVIQAKNLYEKNVYPRVFYQHKYPDEEDLSEAQTEYIRNLVHSMERAIAGDDFKDPALGFRAYLDTVSLANLYIAQEFSKDVDAYRLSMPLYKYPDSIDTRFKFTVWDFNGSMGVADYNDSWSYAGWAHNLNRFTDVTSGAPVPWMFKHILQDEQFYGFLQDKWSAYREERLSDDTILAKIDSLTTVLQESQERNFEIWNRFDRYVWPNYYYASSWEDEINYLKNWLLNRTMWIDSQWMEQEVNYIANGDFESATSQGGKPGTLLAEWASGQEGVELTQTGQYEGDYGLILRNEGKITQVLTELPPGYYTLKAMIQQLSHPAAYFFHQYEKEAGQEEAVIYEIAGDDSYQIFEINDIKVSNHFVELGFGVDSDSDQAALYLDNISFTLQEALVGNQKVENMNFFDVRLSRDQMVLSIFLEGDIPANTYVNIYDMKGALVHRTKAISNQLTFSNMFMKGQVYIVQVGDVSRKFVF